MPSAHAKLSPSAASRWIACPASIRMSEGIKDRESAAAREGTLAHALGEIELLLATGGLSQGDYTKRRQEWLDELSAEGYTDNVRAEIEENIDNYVDFVLSEAAERPGTKILVERRVNTGVPKSWGTSDVVLVAPGFIGVIDLKYGKGIPVSAEGNPQLRLYACGALDEFGDEDTETVSYSVYQPRLDSVSTETLSADELRFWRREVVIPKAEEALADGAGFGPSESACRFCPAAGICRARMESVTDEAFGQNPDLITAEEMGQWLGKFKEIRSWMDAVEAEALDALYERGEEIPGWKSVLSGGRRNISDKRAAMRELEALGFDHSDIVIESLAGLGVLDKLVGGKAELQAVLGPLLTRGAGSPSLAKADDPRKKVTKVEDILDDFE